MSTAAAKKIVLIVGVGPGLGASLATIFAKHGHPVAVAARSLPALQQVAASINSSTTSGFKGDICKPFTVDASSTDSLRKLVQDASTAWGPDAKLSVGIWNPNAGFGIRPFTEWTEAQVKEALDVQVMGAFAFSQSLVQHFLKNESTPDSPTRGTLLFTSATAGIRGSANFSGFAAAKGGVRLMAQSMAKELGKEMIHVAQVVVDGMIDSERMDGFVGKAKSPYERLKPDEIAGEYYHVANQPPTVWTHELDVRPAPEKW